MAAEDRRRIEQWFEQALELAESERAALLRRIGPEDDPLRREVEELLAADAQAGSFMAQPATAALSQGPAAGDCVGPYRIVRRLGEGGMSCVYLAARQDRPADTRVALKLIKPGMDAEPIVRRFHQEREILAELDHPYIARLLDGGSTADGQPYIVMEYVEGQPIDAYCDAQGLSVEARLRLFRAVCAALHHAHAKLVVHRDLKPTNILVTAEGVPKLLDFGIAKLLGPEPGVGAEWTAASHCIWTPQYASPEQVRGRSVTTASDVYSLGVLLYKLLTGCRPYRFVTCTPREIERLVCEVEPPPPSVAVGLAEQAAMADTPPRVSARKLRRRLAGDLDRIVLMALRKEPARRYGSVQELSEDVHRHLQQLPVLAQRSSLAYRTRKFVRRHAVGVLATLLVSASLLTGTLLALSQARAALGERRKAEAEREHAQQVVALLVDIFKVADPAERGAAQVSARQILDWGAARIAVELRGQPEVRATLMDAIGLIYHNLGLHEPADRLLVEALAERRRLLGPDHPDIAESLAHLAMLRHSQAHTEAITLSRQALALRLRAFGPHHAKVAESLHDLALTLQHTDSPEVETLHRRALAERRRLWGPDHPEVAESLNTLAAWLSSHERYSEAEAAYGEALVIRRAHLGDDHTAVLETLADLGGLRHGLGHYREAEALRREVLVRWRRVRGPEDPALPSLETGLALTLCELGRLEEAETLLRQALARRRAQWGDDHPAVDNSLHHLGTLLYLRGRYAEAESALRQALRLRTSRWGLRHRSVASSQVRLAHVRLARGDGPGAERLLEDALRQWRAVLGERNLGVADALDGLAVAHAARHDSATATRLFEQALDLRRAILGPRHPQAAHTMAALGALLIPDDPVRACSLLRNALAVARASYPPEHWRTAEMTSLLGDASRALGRAAEAQALLQQGYAGLRAHLGETHALTREARARLTRPDATSHDSAAPRTPRD